MARMKMVLVMTIGMMALVALIMPVQCDAGSIKIWPDQVRPMAPNAAYGQSVDRALNGVFFAAITPPVGARIVKVTYYHAGAGSPVSTELQLLRTKIGMGPEILAYQSSTDATGDSITVDVPITGDPVVKTGYRYYLHIRSSNENSLFMGAKIVYQ